MSILYLGVRQNVCREGNKTIIICTGNVQSIWSLGMSAAKMDTNSSGLLTRQLILRKNSNSYVLGNKGVASSRCREILLDALAALGYDSRLFLRYTV